MGLDEGLLPHTRSRDDPEELAEERRLFYVGLTRAKDRLYLVRALRRSSFGYHETQEPSRFLEDIDERLIRRQGYRPPRTTSTTWTAERTSSVRTPPSPAHAAILQPRYRPGQRVRHPSWGEGMVVDSRVQEDGEETVDVFFESVGFKRVIASIARLEAVNPD